MSWNNSSANLVTCDMGWHNHPVKAVAVTDRKQQGGRSDGKTDRGTDGRTARPYFTRPFRLPPGVQKYWEKINTDTINFEKLCTSDKFYWKKYWEKINIDTINWEKLFPTGKNYWKKCWEKINTDTINWEKLFNISAEQIYTATC